MLATLDPTAPVSLEALLQAKRLVPILLLTVFWCWESWRPFFGQPRGRWRHGLRNLGLALVNALVIGLAFGTTLTLTAEWTIREQLGLLHWLGWNEPWRFAAAFLLLDLWMYLWHRANHVLPLLWRFHRMHHSDRHMDVTTATRFHLGELTFSAVLRLALIPLLGLEIWHLLLYDTVMLAVIHFHHADISLGRADRWMRWLIVTPDMHKVHHSEDQPETDSNYATILSIWDRLAGTFRFRADPHRIQFGLKAFAAPAWQTWRGMWLTPFQENLPPALDGGTETPSESRMTPSPHAHDIPAAA